jgi:hypothetical protein
MCPGGAAASASCHQWRWCASSGSFTKRSCALLPAVLGSL